MGLMDSIQLMIELLESIQSQLSAMASFFENEISLSKSMIDLSAVDVMALEKNVALLASYREDIDYIILSLERLSGNIHILFWLMISICVVIISVLSYLIVRIIYENRTKIFNLICEVLNHGKKKD